jgi:hypothetical protein
VVVVAPPASGQSAPPAPPPLPARLVPIEWPHRAPSLEHSTETAERRAEELRRWIDDFSRWLEWSSEWTSRREPGWLTSSRDRRQKPAPPEWLPARCAAMLDENDPLGPACGLLGEWARAEAGPPGPVPAALVTQAENNRKTIWWEHIHADLLWPAMQWQSSIYGVVGMHVATTVKGRFQVFLAPGAMLLSLPARNGTRVWKVAANYGIGYRLADFTFFGGRPAALHVNLAKSWLLSDVRDVVSGRTTDFVGLSISFRRFR